MKKNKVNKFSIGKFIYIMIIMSIVIIINKALEKNSEKIITQDLLNSVANTYQGLVVFGYILVAISVGLSIYVVVNKIDLAEKFKM